jgi:SHS2 domain-containing protein
MEESFFGIGTGKSMDEAFEQARAAAFNNFTELTKEQP